MLARRIFALSLCLPVWLLAGTLVSWCAHGQTPNVFTAQFGAPTAPPTVLVEHPNLWSFRRGTNAPQADWQTAADAGLDATWASAPGGFGFGDLGIIGENTTVNIGSVCTTLYIRRSFTVTASPDTNSHLYLVVDYDDGFVAYLDGRELARANLTNGPGTVVANTATTGSVSHEASCCNAPTHPAETFDCGVVSNRLAPGTHVLALIGVNQVISSSDFHLIPDLEVTGTTLDEVNGAILSVVKTNSILLSGSNTMAGSTRVVVNGDEASLNLAQGTWSKTVSLAPGVNQLAIQALDATGHILAATNRMVVADLGSVTVGGLLASNAVWSASNGIVRLTNTVIVPPGGSLIIQEGVVVLANANCSVRATNAALTALGTEDRTVYFLPADGITTNWGGLIVVGTNGTMHLQHVETIAGHIEMLDGVTGTLEDSYFHDYKVSSPAIIHTEGNPNPVTMNLRRCYVSRYHEVLSQLATNHIEGCLLEYQDYSGDGIDFDAGQPGSFIRRCTLRRGNIFNTDALDMGEYSPTQPSRGVLIDSCLLHDFIDKGISMGVNVDITVTNCVIYNVDSGIAVKDYSTAGIYNTTITEANYGYRCYNKANGSAPDGGGFITNSFNNILWHFTNETFSFLNGSTLVADYCDFDQTNWPGTGHISGDPLFVDAAHHNYRLASNSPAIGSGFNGANMGAGYPVGGIPPAPWNLAALTLSSNQITLVWQEDADNEDGFEIQRSTNQVNWEVVGGAAANATEATDVALALDQHYYYRVRATNYLGVSGWSGFAGATLRAPVNQAAGTLTGNTVWSGTVYVTATVTVPANVTLTVLPGTVVNLTNSASISAQANGVIDIEGAFTNRVLFRPWATNGGWGTINASGNNSSITIRHAELDRGGVNLGSEATGVIEDSYVHDVYSAIVANSAHSATVRRCHVNHYSETIYNSTPVLAEDLLLENMTDPNSDALEIQGASASFGCIVRRCVARHSTGGNSDALDFNGSSGILLEDCIISDFSDKGVSMGASGTGGTADFGITIRNCLIYNVDTGIAVKDGITASVYQNTIADANYGMRLYQKYTSPVDGGHVTNGYNNILWGHTNVVSLLNNSSLALNFSDVQGTNWPGTGNIASDPLFVNAAQHDYHLASNSPCVGTGSNGLNMGVSFPIGLYILTPGNLTAVARANSMALSWLDNSVSESVYEVERSINGSSFTNLATLPANTTNFVDAEVSPGYVYHYRVRGRSIVADSEYSTEVSATLCAPPLITLQPASRLAQPGADAAFSVTATGCDPLRYQWQFNLALLDGQTNSTLVLSNVTLAAAGNYRVIVTGSGAPSATSEVAVLTVEAPPQLELVSGSGLNSNGVFALTFMAASNITAVLEASTNLVQWLPVQTNRTGNGQLEFADPASPGFPWRFYRIQLRP
jgi:hypothetical protein